MDQKHPKMFIKAEGSPTHFLVYIYHIKFSTDVFAWEQLSKTGANHLKMATSNGGGMLWKGFTSEVTLWVIPMIWCEATEWFPTEEHQKSNNTKMGKR